MGIATGWEGSRRREELPPNWPTLRAQVIERDHGLCQWRMSDGSICAEDGTDVDHIRDRDDTLPTRLAGHVERRVVVDVRNALVTAVWQAAGWTVHQLGRPTQHPHI